MPTYHYQCQLCRDDKYLWRSIHQEPLELGECGHPVALVIDAVNVLGSSEATRIDNIEANWSKDMPAYKRFRDAGHQPPGIDGCDHLEATAQSELEIKSGGRIKVSDRVARESRALADDIMKGRA